MIDKHELQEILTNCKESNTLDYKREWHENNANLLHDILCLANAVTETPTERRIIIGVDDEQKIHGIAEDKKRKTSAELNDFLSKINPRMPAISVVQILTDDSKKVDVITIADEPNKPYYLFKDYIAKSKKNNNELIAKVVRVVRAGVIYSRLDDRNTPLSDAGIDDLLLQKMFEERLSINKGVEERFLKYLEDYRNWNLSGSSDGLAKYYYDKFPEFQIIEKNIQPTKITNFESWMPKAICSTPVQRTYELLHHSIVIRELCTFDSGDNNYEMCWPQPPNNEEKKYYYMQKSFEYYFSCLLAKHTKKSKAYHFEKLKMIEIKEEETELA